jgi:hypothetical protein
MPCCYRMNGESCSSCAGTRCSCIHTDADDCTLTPCTLTRIVRCISTSASRCCCIYAASWWAGHLKCCLMHGVVLSAPCVCCLPAAAGVGILQLVCVIQCVSCSLYSPTTAFLCLLCNDVAYYEPNTMPCLSAHCLGHKPLLCKLCGATAVGLHSRLWLQQTICSAAAVSACS